MKLYLLILLLIAVPACNLSAQSSASLPLDIQLIPPTNIPTDAPFVQAAQVVTPSRAPTTIPTMTFTPVPTVIPTEDRNMSDLPTYGTAPELNNTAWLNTAAPLRLADLRGSVVLLEFWTFDCINCIRTIPYVQQWHQTYADQGLVVIGNHYPEFDYERDIQSVQAAAGRLGITYAVAQDNDAATWRAYNQRYWPTIYLIDKWGTIRYYHIGEGQYPQTEAAIQALLAERYTAESPAETPTPRRYLTPIDGLNVRTGAGTQYDQIGFINPNMVFVVLGEENGWYIINYNGRSGYVSGDYVTVETQ